MHFDRGGSGRWPFHRRNDLRDLYIGDRAIREDFHFAWSAWKSLEGSRLRLPGRCKQRNVFSADRVLPQSSSSSSSSSFSTSLDAGIALIATRSKIENEDEDDDDWRGAYTALNTYKQRPSRAPGLTDRDTIRRTVSFVVAAPPLCDLVCVPSSSSG